MMYINLFVILVFLISISLLIYKLRMILLQYIQSIIGLHPQIEIFGVIIEMLVFQVLGEFFMIQTKGILLVQKPPAYIFWGKVQKHMPMEVIIIITHTTDENIPILTEGQLPKIMVRNSLKIMLL